MESAAEMHEIGEEDITAERARLMWPRLTVKGQDEKKWWPKKSYVVRSRDLVLGLSLYTVPIT